MNCERIQDLILTDYLDGQMEISQKKHLEEHLALCPQCLEFAQAAKKTVFEPFVHAEKLEVPASVWSGIEGSILAEQQGQRNLLVRFWENLKLNAPIPRPAFAFATVVVLALLVGTVAELKTGPMVKTDEQIEYIESLASLSDGSFVAEDSGFATSVEQYFL